MSIIDAFRLDGKVAVVTGANTGLGQGMSVALAQAGAKVVGVARRSCEDTKKLIEADGGEFAEVIADLSDMSAIEIIVNGALAAFGKVDILVNNAGIIKRQDAIEFTEENWDSVIQVNQKMVFFLSQAFAKQLMKQGEKVSNIEITDQNIKAFDPIARKSGLDYNVKKIENGKPPTYLVSFKGKDIDVMTEAFREFTAKKLGRDKKPSIRKLLSTLKDKAAALNAQKDKVKKKDREVSL